MCLITALWFPACVFNISGLNTEYDRHTQYIIFGLYSVYYIVYGQKHCNFVVQVRKITL